MSTFADLFNEAVADQFSVSHHHLAVAIWYDGQALPRIAHHFYGLAVSARNRAMMLVQYMLDTGMPVGVSAVPEPPHEFGTPLEAMSSALERERASTQLFKSLSSAARDGGHLIAERYLGWFLTTQAERTARLARLAKTVERAQGTNILLAEASQVEEATDSADPSAPRAAGGVLTARRE